MTNIRTFTGQRTSAINSNVSAENKTRIYLIGTMRALSHDDQNVMPTARKAQAVLGYLCLARGEPQPRSRVAGVIWDQTGESQARESLRQALAQLKRMKVWSLQTDHETVRLDISACWIDALEIPGQPDLLLQSLYGISTGFDEWLIGERTRFEARWQRTLERELNDLVTKDAAPELRAAAARRLLNLVPTHERAVRRLMKAFADMDDGAQAIREYERFRLTIIRSLGMPPSDKTVALQEAIRLRSRAKGAHVGAWHQRQFRGTDDLDHDLPRAPAEGAARGNHSQPSIAVLPFRNWSSEPGHGFVAEGLAEDLVEAVSRVPSLFVISRLSASTFGNEDRPTRDIGAALGARYILSGSVRVADERLRLVVELVEAETGRALWVSRFDRKFSHLLDLQSDLAEGVISSIAPQLRAAELKRVHIKRQEDYDAYDLFLSAQENMHSSSRAVFESSERLFELAIGREPNYATALAWRAYWHVMRVGQGWSPNRAFDAKQAEHFAHRAIECDELEPMAFAVRGHVAAYLHKDFEAASACFETALRINPNCARAWLWNASAHGWMGEGTHAVDKITRAMALSPYDPLLCAYSGSASLAYLADGQYARSIEFGLRCVRENPAYSAAYKTLIPALVFAGHEAEARSQVHLLRALEPDFTVRRFRQRFPGGDTAIGDACCEGLAMAGVPLSD